MLRILPSSSLLSCVKQKGFDLTSKTMTGLILLHCGNETMKKPVKFYRHLEGVGEQSLFKGTMRLFFHHTFPLYIDSFQLCEINPQNDKIMELFFILFWFLPFKCRHHICPSPFAPKAKPITLKTWDPFSGGRDGGWTFGRYPFSIGSSVSCLTRNQTSHRRSLLELRWLWCLQGRSPELMVILDLSV